MRASYLPRLGLARRLIAASQRLHTAAGQEQVQRDINEFEVRLGYRRARRGGEVHHELIEQRQAAERDVEKYRQKLGLDDTEPFYTCDHPLRTHTYEHYVAADSTSRSIPQNITGSLRHFPRTASLTLHYLDRTPLEPITLNVGIKKSFHRDRQMEMGTFRLPLRNVLDKAQDRDADLKEKLTDIVSIRRKPGSFCRMEPHLIPRIAVEREDEDLHIVRPEFKTFARGKEVFGYVPPESPDHYKRPVPPRHPTAPDIWEIFKDTHRHNKDTETYVQEDATASMMEIQEFERRHETQLSHNRSFIRQK